MEILVIKLGAIGDVIRTTTILPGLKAEYKDCRIDWVTKKESFDVLKNNNYVNKIYLIDKLKINKKYDLVINLDDDYEACELASKIDSKKMIGSFLKNSKKTYTKNSSLWFGMGLISKFGKQKADILKAKNKKSYQEIIYKILGLKYKRQKPILKLTKNELYFGKKFSKRYKIKNAALVIGINTGAGGRWEDKKLSMQKTVELIGKLNKEIPDVKILLFGGPEEKERNEKIKELLQTKIIDAGCDNSVMEFASLVNLCNLLVTSDSLALHIGVALRKKIAAFFGPTSSAEIEMYSGGIKIIPKKGCLCCYKQKCDIPPEYDVNEMIKAVKKLVLHKIRM